MRKRFTAVFICVLSLLCTFLCGCDSCEVKPDPELACMRSAYPVIKEENKYFDLISVDGRDFVEFGKPRWPEFDKKTMIKETIGYVYDPDDPSSKEELVALLYDADGFILVSKRASNEKIYRALDTMGQDIEIPYFIESYCYGIWN